MFLFDEIEFFSPHQREREDRKDFLRAERESLSRERERETVGQRERQTKERERRFAVRRVIRCNGQFNGQKARW